MEQRNNNHGAIGRRIRDARQRKGWTQLEFALAAGISPSTVQRWERGQLPRIRELMRAAEVLEVPASTFVEPPEERASMEALIGAVERVAGAVERNEANLAALRDQQAQIVVRLSDLQTRLDEQQG